MMHRVTATTLAMAILSVAVTAASIWAAEANSAATPAAGPGGVVLDENSLWRTFDVRRHAYVRSADGKLERKQVTWYWGALAAKAVAAPASAALPPADWAGPDFDDISWPRNRLPLFASGTGEKINYDTGLIVLRGKFQVADPAAVKDLRLALAYYGGAAVYVNGKEVARGNLPAAATGTDLLAEDYPVEAVTTPEGKPLHPDDQKNVDRLALRERKLPDVQIPVALLRKGVNVLAIEVHAAAVPEAAFKGSDTHAGWPPIGLRAIRLTASPAGSVDPNLARPNGMQLWNCSPWETVTVFDYGNEPVRPITFFGARNGVFSGRLMVSSNQAIKGLKASVTELVQGDKGDKIPASAIRLRCAQPTTPATVNAGLSWTPSDRFDALLDTIPSDVAVNANKQGSPAGKNWTAGAVAPLWITVRIPKDAKPGIYEGAVTVSADGLAATTVPVKLTVHDWTLPDPKDFRSSVCGYCLPETLAAQYNVALWSERHLELMGQSLAMMAELNSHQVLVNLSINWYGIEGVGGNQQSEVRWIKQADGTFKYDFSVFDKHLDVVAKSIGKPRPLRLNCWVAESKPYGKLWDEPKTLREQGGYVTTLDPATGKLDQMAQPCPGTPESLAFWKPVLDEIRKKIEARGWWDVTCVGHSHPYGGIDPAVVDVYRKIWPDGVWAITAHGGTLGSSFAGTEKGVAGMPVRYSEGVWTIPQPKVRGGRVLLDPKRPSLWYGGRHFPMNPTPLEQIRWVHELHLLEQCDGTQLGADVFPRKLATGGGYDFEACNRGDLGPTTGGGTRAILGAGPDGLLTTERYEAFREGEELAEAVLFLEQALQSKKLSGDLEQRVNQCLDARSGGMVRDWYQSANATEQDGKLLTLAGEAAAAMSGNK